MEINENSDVVNPSANIGEAPREKAETPEENPQEPPEVIPRNNEEPPEVIPQGNEASPEVLPQENEEPPAAIPQPTSRELIDIIRTERGQRYINNFTSAADRMGADSRFAPFIMLWAKNCMEESGALNVLKSDDFDARMEKSIQQGVRDMKKQCPDAFLPLGISEVNPPIASAPSGGIRGMTQSEIIEDWDRVREMLENGRG